MDCGEVPRLDELLDEKRAAHRTAGVMQALPEAYRLMLLWALGEPHRTGDCGKIGADFLQALGEGKSSVPTFRDGLATDHVTDSVLKSAKSRQWEKVPLPHASNLA